MFSRKIIYALVAVCLALAASAQALAGRGGTHGNKAAPASCAASGSIVEANGLPTDEVIDFMLTDSRGTSGWVLGFTSSGTWSVKVPEASGPTTYEFVSRTSGPNGSKYTVFATCSA